MQAASENPVWVLGQMSGTSLDGIDLALVRSDGGSVHAFGSGRMFPYSPRIRAVLAEATDTALAADSCVLADRNRWPAALQDAESLVTETNAAAVADFLATERELPEMIGFHGQTVVHRPEEALTVQLGDGDRLAELTGLDVIWDFRAADLRAGGQGAPLAPFFHHCLGGVIGAAGRYAVLNLGGIANLSIVDAAVGQPEAPGALVAFDTGPGCGLLDDWAASRAAMPFDEGGRLAKRGRCDENTLRELLRHGYFRKPPPKSADRHAFSIAPVAGLSPEDGSATLAIFTVETVARGLAAVPPLPSRVLVTGGGRRNGFLLESLAGRLDCPVEPVEAVGLDGDLLEAQAFAHLAVRSRAGLPLTAPGTTGCGKPVCGGRLARSPKRAGGSGSAEEEMGRGRTGPPLSDRGGRSSGS